MNKLFLIALLVLIPLPAQAKVIGQTIEYKQADTALEGYLAYDDAIDGKRPGIIVVHDWMGISDNVKARVDMLAQLGYVAFAVDIYGKDVRPKNTDEAMAQVKLYKSDVTLMRARALAGLDVLKQNSLVDSARLAAMGYCFGGTVSLEMARAGANLLGVISFHGGLSTPYPEDAKNIKAKVLVLHGADDPHVSSSEITAFQKEMNDAGVDWQMVYYSGAVHAFTSKAAGDDNSKGAAYNANADRRSWEAMKQFFAEIF